MKSGTNPGIRIRFYILSKTSRSVPSLLDSGIIIKNTVGYANRAVAELVLGLMISLIRNIPFNNRQICHGTPVSERLQI